MKAFITRHVRWMMAAALIVSVFAPALAADDDDSGSDDMSPSEKADERFPQPVVVGTLIDRAVLQPTESQPILGHVRAVVRDGDGSIKVIVAYGGFLGFGARPIAVPVEAMVLLGQYMEIVDFTPDQLEGFPSYSLGGKNAVGAGETIRVGLAKPSH